MSENREFDDILNDCLQQLLEGKTLDECLAVHPQQAAVLEPLLKTVAAAKQSLQFEPDPRFKTETKRQLLTILAGKKEEKAVFKTPFLARFKLRWATAAVSLVLVLLMSGGGLAVASSGSMPGEAFYGVKLVVEQVMLQFSFTSLAKAETYAKLADRRVNEIIYLADKGDVPQIEAATERLGSYLTSITSLLEPNAKAAGDTALPPRLETSPDTDNATFGSQTSKTVELELLLGQYGMKHTAALEQALITASDAVKPALYEAIVITIAGYQNALNVID